MKNTLIINELMNFFFNKSMSVMMIEGKSTTGKTYLVKNIFK